VADAHLAMSAFPEASVALREVLVLNPADEEARETLATTLTRAGELDAAGSEWRELAMEREKAEDVEGAERAWTAVLSVRPLDLDARRLRARCAMRLGHEEDAGVQYLALGDVLRVAGREDEAIEAYRHSRDLCAGEPIVLGRLIAAFVAMGLEDSALEVRRALMALERERGNWAGLFRAAWDLRSTLGEDDEIREALDLSLGEIQAERARAAVPVESAAETDAD
jgi:tetratricopeptide (TPR) repeat protein